MDNRNSQKGFTLMEMLLVLFICSLAVLPALYNWHQQLQRIQLVDTAKQVAEFIYSSVMEGIYLNQHRVLQIINQNGHWQLVVRNALTNDEIKRLTSDEFSDIEISAATRLVINLYGKQGTGQAFRIGLKNKQTSLVLIMSSLGRVRACSNQKIAGIPTC